MISRIATLLGLLACLLAVCVPANATISFDSSTGTQNAHNLTQSRSSSFSTSNSNEVLLVWVYAYNPVGGGDPEISVSGASITWTQEYSTDMQAGNGVFYLFYGVATSQLNNATITVSTGLGHNIYISYLIDAYSGCDTTSPIDQVASSTSGTSVSLTTGQSNTLAVGAMYDRADGEDYAAGTGYTLDPDDSYVNFINSDRWGDDEYANSETASSGTNVTVSWDDPLHSGDLTMIGATLVDGS